MSEWSDGDYPTDAALDKIAAWPIATVSDCSELLRFIQPIWHFGAQGMAEKRGRLRYYRQVMIPRRANLEAARADAERMARAS